MYLATPLAFAFAASLVTSATPFFPSADKATVSPEYTRPSIQEQLALVKNKPGLANIIASDQDDATGDLPYNFTLAATAQGRQRDPSLCRKLHQEGILGDAVEFSLREAKLIYDNYEVAFGFDSVKPLRSSLERPGNGWGFYAAEGILSLIDYGYIGCDTYAKKRPISYNREYFERY